MSSLTHCSMSGFDTICNSLRQPLADIVLFGLSLPGFPLRFWNASAKKRFPHPYNKECFVPLSNRCEISHPLRGLASLLTHRPVSGSDTICNSLSPPLTNIVLFRLSLNIFKTRLLERGFHTLIKNASFFSPTDVRSHNPPPFRAQRPYWRSFLSRKTRFFRK